MQHQNAQLITANCNTNSQAHHQPQGRLRHQIPSTINNNPPVCPVTSDHPRRSLMPSPSCAQPTTGPDPHMVHKSMILYSPSNCAHDHHQNATRPMNRILTGPSTPCMYSTSAQKYTYTSTHMRNNTHKLASQRGYGGMLSGRTGDVPSLMCTRVCAHNRL